jgi:hypothetical protein
MDKSLQALLFLVVFKLFSQVVKGLEDEMKDQKLLGQSGRMTIVSLCSTREFWIQLDLSVVIVFRTSSC